MGTKTCCLALALLTWVLTAAKADAQNAGAVDAVRPQAIIQRTAIELKAETGTGINWDDLLHTDNKGRLRVQLLDQSLISLGPDSQVRVIRQAASFGPECA